MSPAQNVPIDAPSGIGGRSHGLVRPPSRRPDHHCSSGALDPSRYHIARAYVRAGSLGIHRTPGAEMPRMSALPFPPMGDSEEHGRREEPDDSNEIPWQSIFEGRSPREILARLVEGDPLRISEGCAGRIVERAVILDPDRLLLRAVARVAHAGFSYRGMPPFREWLRGCLDLAIDDLVREDVEYERSGMPIAETGDKLYRGVAEGLGIEPGLARRVCVEINTMEDDMRHAFFAVHVLRKTIHRHVAEGYGPPARVQALLKEALRRLRRIGGPGGTA